MKYLSNYMDSAMSETLKKHDAFFAFGKSQFDEAKKDGVKYYDMGGGLVCPIDNAKDLRKAMDDVYNVAIAQDIEENGLNAIILRELYNHEAFYTGDIDSTYEAIGDYPGATRELVAEIYKQNINKQD